MSDTLTPPPEGERRETLADVPGMNTDAERQAVSFAVQACPLFLPSQHANARPSGPGSLCVQCHKPQSQHWLRQLLTALRASERRVPALLSHYGLNGTAACGQSPLVGDLTTEWAYVTCPACATTRPQRRPPDA